MTFKLNFLKKMKSGFQFNQKIKKQPNTKNQNTFHSKSKSQAKILTKKPKTSPIQFVSFILINSIQQPNNDYALNTAMNNLTRYHENLLTKQKPSLSQVKFQNKYEPETYEEDISLNINSLNMDTVKSQQALPIKMEMNNNNSNKKMNDKKLLYTLRTLDLENLFNDFNINMITFNDLFLLSKDDLIEMKIPIGPRNRILHFADAYTKYAKDYDFNELIEFFNNHKGLIINSINDSNNNNNISNYNNHSKHMHNNSMIESAYTRNVFNTQIKDEIQFPKQESLNISLSQQQQQQQNKMFKSSMSNVLSQRTPNSVYYNIQNDNNIPNIEQYTSCDNIFDIKNNSYTKCKKNNNNNNDNKNISLSMFKTTTSVSSGTNCTSPCNEQNSMINRTCSSNVNTNNNSQIVQNFQNLFTEVENFQQQYEHMKIKNTQRNNKINNLLSKNHSIVLKDEPTKTKIEIDSNDLLNETERNLNDELGKLYDNSNSNNNNINSNKIINAFYQN